MTEGQHRPIMEGSEASPSLYADNKTPVQPTPRSVVIKNRVIWFGKKFLMFMISHVGLTCLVVAYSIMGGFVFMELEASHEKERIREIGNIREDHVKELWQITQQLNILYEPNWTSDADVVFKRFQKALYNEVKDSGWDGTDQVTDDNIEWTFAGSLLYSVTVITTIGYGHLTPRTLWGRIVTMLYALIGIPLTLLCLTNIGSFMANLFRLFWKHIMCGICRQRQRQRLASIRRASSQKLVRGSEIHGNDVMLMPKDSRTADCPQKKIVEIVRVPIIVCLSLVVLYIFLGAMLFTLWEKDWNYLEGSYFCFITLSTIGFGDFVPGHGHSSWENQAKRVSCTLYLLFGLALLAMCFDLMQAEIREKCRDAAKFLGFSKRDPENV